jgi:histone H3/H4
LGTVIINIEHSTVGTRVPASVHNQHHIIVTSLSLNKIQRQGHTLKENNTSPGKIMSLWNQDTIRDVSESVGISNISDEVANNLAMDVEYRIHQVLQEATKYMRHAKRFILTTSDVLHALRVLNVEPLYGYDCPRPLRYGEASIGPAQPVFYVEDEEVDFEKLINAPLPKVPRDVMFTGNADKWGLVWSSCFKLTGRFL